MSNHQTGEVTSLADVIDELYSGDLDQFTARRTQLAAEAKKAGDKDSAAAVTALRKPTQAAFTINRLARTDPRAVDELVSLGSDLQRAQRISDAPALRDLNRRRRTLLNELLTRAFEVIGQQAPSAGQREEVTATLQAALADPGLAEQLRGGALVKAAESSGFGFTPPELTLLTGSAPAKTSVAAGTTDAKQPATAKPPRGERSTPSRTPAGGRQTSHSAPATTDQAADHAERISVRQRADAAAERKQEARAKAQQDAAATDATVDEAVAAIDAGQQLIRSLQRQLGEAKRQLETLQKAAKDAEARQRRARQALNAFSRAGKPS